MLSRRLHRVGSVEALRFRQMPEVLRDMLAYLVSARGHHFPPHPTGLEDPVKDYLRRFVVQTAVTAAKMDAIGFVHGMLNSDNHVSDYLRQVFCCPDVLIFVISLAWRWCSIAVTDSRAV